MYIYIYIRKAGMLGHIYLMLFYTYYTHIYGYMYVYIYAI